MAITRKTPSAYIIFPPSWGDQVVLRRRFVTNVMRSIDSTEQRNNLNYKPTRELELTLSPNFVKSGMDLENIIRENIQNPIGVPVWTEEMELSSAVTAGESVLNVESTEHREIYSGEYAVVVSNYDTYEVVYVEDFDDSTITISGEMANSFASGKKVYPLITARIPSVEDFSTIGYDDLSLKIVFVETFDCEDS